MDGVDPCSLLTAGAAGGAGVDERAAREQPVCRAVSRRRADLHDATVRSPDPIILGIGTVTTVGVERWREGDLAAETRPTVGRTAFRPSGTAHRSSTDYCSVEVDVAAGQLLDVQLFDGGGTPPPIPQEELCSTRRAGRPSEIDGDRCWRR